MYTIYEEEYLDIKIDGIFLDIFLDSLFPGKEIKGLVPPFDGWLQNKKDQKFTIDRIIPKNEISQICPILICPDDQDFSCTTIVTQISLKNKFIIWENIGFEKSYKYPNLDTFGQEVEWFNKKLKFKFIEEEYLNEIGKFS